MGGKALYFFCRVALSLLSLVLVYGTAIPLVRSDAWWIRVFDFPRLQIAPQLGLMLAGYAALRDLIRNNDPDIIPLSEPTQWWAENLDGLGDHASIDEDVLFILNCFLKQFGRKAAYGRQVTKHRRAFGIQLVHQWIIWV